MNLKENFEKALNNLCSLGFTPYIVVDAGVAGVLIPSGYAKNGLIVLDISGNATQGFGNDDFGMSYFATFTGEEYYVNVPYAAVKAIYPKGSPSLALPLDSEHNVYGPIDVEAPTKPNKGWADSAYIVEK
jgi:stringent starvation protein B